MRSIRRRFERIKEENPYWSSLICFTGAVWNQNFSRQAIHRWFNKLVDKDDYVPSDKKQVLSYIEQGSKRAEDDKK